ncbi:hypothetical protein CDAR_198331 [Caerostris darwini]|uniref:Uncharacterized protein n=1 Tax=Caerostris darwini TaxID=1538125 RepID=A0AAV4WV02_9ARAC|nr:hypothetical protein CDAR_198331 [Caerostris darwini]
MHKFSPNSLIAISTVRQKPYSQSSYISKANRSKLIGVKPAQRNIHMNLAVQSAQNHILSNPTTTKESTGTSTSRSSVCNYSAHVMPVIKRTDAINAQLRIKERAVDRYRKLVRRCAERIISVVHGA